MSLHKWLPSRSRSSVSFSAHSHPPLPSQEAHIHPVCVHPTSLLCLPPPPPLPPLPHPTHQKNVLSFCILFLDPRSEVVTHTLTFKSSAKKSITVVCPSVLGETSMTEPGPFWLTTHRFVRQAVCAKVTRESVSRSTRNCAAEWPGVPGGRMTRLEY